MAKGLFFGLTTVDIISIVDTNPGPNLKVRAAHQLISAGGPAANSSVAFGALGNEAQLVSGIGRHPVAGLAFSDLDRHGVDVHDHAGLPDALPVLSSIIVESQSGERSVVYSDTRNRRLAPDVPYHRYGNSCAVALFDGHYLDQAIPLAASLPDEVIVVLDGGSWKEGLEELLPHLDYAICSADFKPPGCASQAEVLGFLMEQELIGSAISNGPDPLVYQSRTEQGLIKISSVEAIDTLGAGDILHGAFCHFIIANSFSESLQRAADIASSSCRHYGAREWINHL